MKRTKIHNKKIGDALRGKIRSIEHRRKISENARLRLSNPKSNPNYRGDNVGYIGIHIWLRKVFGYPLKCEKCGKIGERINNKWTIVYAKIKGLLCERKRENFICLCNRCHRNYDKNIEWNNNIKKSKLRASEQTN